MSLFRATFPLLDRGHYVIRLRTRMSGYIPKVVPRKVKGKLMMLRSEAQTGWGHTSLKSEAERLDPTGKRSTSLEWDPIVRRNVLFREGKPKAPRLVRSNVANPVKPV